MPMRTAPRAAPCAPFPFLALPAMENLERAPRREFRPGGFRYAAPPSGRGAMSSATKSGFWATVGAFLVWGVFPIYWKWLRDVPALQIMAHRLAWCFLLVATYLAVRRG